MKSLTVKTHADSQRESEFFNAILTLAGSVLKHDWRIVDTDPADVVIVSFDSTEPYSAWDEYSGKYPPERLVAYTDENIVKGAKWHLQRTQGSMPRLSEVVRMLNNLGYYFNAGNTPPLLPDISGKPPQIAVTPLPPVPVSAEKNVSQVENFHLQEHLAGIVQQAVALRLCKVCAMPGYPPVYLFPKENAVYTAADSITLSALCRVDVERIHVTDLLEHELLEEVASLGLVKRRPLAEFLWFSILTGSNGRILADYRREEPVHLREWPGHVRLSFYAMYHDIATQMAAGISGLSDIARNSAAPVENVIDFHNACAVLGLIAHGEEGRRLAMQKAESRAYLRSVLKPICPANGYIKLVVVGSVGAGKTTALTTLSETPPLLTEASPSDNVASIKATTTVAMEYGEMRIDDDAKLQIYGTPGQKRFDFMGQILCAWAWGLVILIDNTEPDPLAELKYYIDRYTENFEDGNVAVGISHYDDADTPSIDEYAQYLADNGYRFHLSAVDPRDSRSLAALLASLAQPLET